MTIHSCRSLLIACLFMGQFAPAFAAGCSKDTDCKGERICEKHVCVEPETLAPRQNDSVYSTRPRPAPPAPAAATPPTTVVQPVVSRKKPTLRTRELLRLPDR